MRISNRLTLKELAQRSKLDDRFIGEIERGKEDIFIFTLFKIAAGLDLKDPNKLLIDAKLELYKKDCLFTKSE